MNAATATIVTKVPASATIPLSAKVRELANKAHYGAPKLVSFPLARAPLGGSLSFAGNTIIPPG